MGKRRVQRDENFESMAHDSDISFGDVEEARPGRARRPDRNRHYAVVAYGEPSEHDLPIFVDLDVLIDMETHALSDTRVELGGVLLGGQWEDDDGRPFVLVTDSLRAEHYEATKGSFKFTHETWQQISRQRDEYPPDVAMVGWYHTHPDWGVFLSGMDTFICDHFFNRPLDVALVIDPCRQDRGWFQWTGDPREKQRRVAGFYVVASRLRQEELKFFVAQLEGQMPVRTAPGYSVAGSSPAPIVNIHEEKAGWLGTAVMGLLGMQFLFLLFVAAALFVPRLKNEEETAAQQQIAALERQVEALKQASLDSARLADRQRLLDEVVAKLDPTAAGAIHKLAEAEDEIVRLRAATVGFRQTEKEYAALRTERDQLAANLKSLTEAKKTADRELTLARAKLDALAAKDAEAAKAAKTPANPGDLWTVLANPTTIAAIVASLVIVGGLIAAMVLQRAPAARSHPPGEVDPPRELEIEGEEPPRG